MTRSPNAQIAADAFQAAIQTHGYDKGTAWKAIAELLLTCDIWEGGWKPFKDVVVYREVNDFKDGKKAALARAEALSQFLATELGVPRGAVCAKVGAYWRIPKVSGKQPNNLVGHAFRSMLVEALRAFGDPGVEYAEEVDPNTEFPGQKFPTRSKKAKIDIVARRGNVTVALISARWRFRHDRVDLVDEAMAYIGPARRANPGCQFYAWLGEFAPNRLIKVLEHCPPTPNPALSAAVHFHPALITEGLKENGRTAHLKSLEWLIDQSFSWG